MTTIGMLRVHVTLFALIGATWWNVSACDDTTGAGTAGGPSTGEGGHAGGSAIVGDAAGGGGARGASAAPHWKILSVNGGGSGCPDLDKNDVSYDAATGTLKVEYQTMSLSYDAGSSSIQNTNCVASLLLLLDPGWQMAAASVTAHGSAKLAGGAKGRQTTRTFFAGSAAENDAVVSLGGPYDGAYHEEETFSAGEQVWSTCGGSPIFTVDAGLNLQVGPGSQGLSGIRLHEVKVEIDWRPC